MISEDSDSDPEAESSTYDVEVLVSKRPIEPLTTWDKKTIGKMIFSRIVSYYFVHFSYIVILSLIGGGIIMGMERNISYVDALFTSTSAVTTTGLIVVDTSQLKIITQVLLTVLIFLGNHILLSLVPPIKRIFFNYIPKLRSSTIDRERNYVKLQIRACVFLIIIVLIYFFYIFFLGMSIFLILGLDHEWVYIIHDKYRNYSPWWFSFFTVTSNYANAGFALLPDSAISYNKMFVPIFTQGLLILAGNSCFPIIMRITVGFLRLCMPFDPAVVFIDKQPRLVYTHMFPYVDTLQFAFIICVLNTFQWALALGLDWNEPILEDLNTFERIYTEAFQSISTKMCGANSLNISQASIAVIVLYIGCMYISAYPIAISIRGSKSRGQESHGTHVRDMLFDDLGVIFVSILLICIFENTNLKDDSENYSFLRIVFEVVSAQGTVGLSLGFGNYPVSFSYGLRTVSKVVIIFTMWIGRHRGLPHSDDPAITGKISLDDMEIQWHDQTYV